MYGDKTRATIPQLIANNMSGRFFLKHDVYRKQCKIVFVTCYKVVIESGVCISNSINFGDLE